MSMRLVLAFLLVSSTAHADDDVVAKVIAHYDAAAHWTGKFTQESTTHKPDVTTTRTGTIVLARGGKLRLESAKPKEATVADGTSLWLVNHDAKVILQKPESNAPIGAVALIVAGARVQDEFTAQVDSTEGAITVRLTPKKSSKWISRVTWIVDPKDFHVRETTVVDSGGDSERIVFGKLDRKPAVKPAVFTVDRKSKPLRKYSYDRFD